jgi:hypothetical protein
MSGLTDAGRIGPSAKRGAESFLSHRPAVDAADIRQFADRAGGDRLGERERHGDRDRLPSLFRLHPDHAVAHVRSPDAHGVAPTQSALPHELKREPCGRSKRPAGAELRLVVFGPYREAAGLRPRHGDSGRRVDGGDPGFDQPFEKRANALDKMLRGSWGGGALITASDNVATPP